MYGRRVGDPGPKHLDQAPFYQPPPPVSSSAPSTTEGHLDPHDSNIDVQNHQPSGQEPKDRRAALERAFAACNLYPTAEHHRSAASNSGLFVPKRSRSPEKEDAPPFQYRAPRRPAGYHLSSSRPAPSSNPPIAASFSQEAESSGHYVQSLSQGKSSPLCLTQGAFIQSFNHRGPPLACPPRSPIVEQFSQAELSRLNSTKGPFVEPFEKSPPLSVTQRSTAKPLLFDPTESFAESYRSPQLVPPHRPGGYNPILNPYIPKPKSSSSQPSKKPGFWGRAKRKFSGRRVSSHQSTRPTTPVGRSPPHSPVTTPFSRPSPPTPNRERSISQAKVHLSGQNYDETLVRKGSEAASPLNQVAGTKTPFFVADKGKAILQTNPAGDWEAEALREREVRSKRIFGHPDSIFGAFGVYTQLRSQYLSNLQDSPEISAPEPNKPRESVDSSETLAPQPERPGRSQYSAETVTSQLQNPRTSQDSATTLVPQPEDTRIYRDPEDRYYSLIVTHKNRPQVVGGREETNEWVEILASTFEKLESSPVPSYLFEDYCDVGGNQTARSQISDSPQEQDPPRSLGEVNPIETPRARVHRRLSERGIVNAICRSLPDGQLAPSTPKGSGRSQTYFALTGGSPTNSLCLEWEKENPDSSVREEVGRHFHPKLEDQVDDLRSVYAAGRVEEHSPTRGRGQLHEGQGFPSEESSTAAKRRAAADRRRRLKGYPVRDREGPGEGIIDRFIDSQRRFDRPKSLRSNAAPGEEVGELVPKRILSAAKQGVERRRRLADALDEVAASANESSLDKALATTNPLENYNHSDHAGKVDEDLVPSSDSAREIPKESVKRLTDTLQQYSSEFQEQDLLVCIRSKTGTVKELPVTPENKLKIKAVLQLESGYTASVYSSDDKESVPPPVADLHPSPLALKKKSPTPPNSRQTSHKPSSFSEADPFRTAHSFLDSCLSVSEEHSLPTMETLQVSSALRSSTKTKAEEDARAMQKSVIEGCKKAGRDPPKYVLMELIGKGSFGRVYKGKDINTTKIVAVKIIDIDESDTLNPRLADTYSEIMKEVNALKILSESKAKNINHVIEALPVGTAMWMITEYCGGGSIATLMKPTPDGLKEKFIIPILREVAEAVKWVHQAGIIHRDLKCANILITEEGGVQLCDFGVAGITETALDKRSTFIGTFHWMAPELFRGSQYGKEVDIWAFGSMTYEMATGLPPNAMSGVTGMDLGAYLKTHIPRLEGDTYSEGLKSVVAFCLEENPSDRPSIEAVQRHSYIYNTTTKYPSSGLSDLVKAFKLWEFHGGTRKSLFATRGAQGPLELSSTALSDDSWNFSTTPAFDQAVAQATNTQDIINVYGASVALGTDFVDETSRPIRQQQSRPSRRRPPPEALAPLKAPLEKLFDPNTMSNYKDNAISHFNLQPNTASDLPLRDDSAQTSIRDTLIDLDAHDIPSGLSSFSEMDTMKPTRRAVQDESEEGYESSGSHDFSRPALSDPVDNPNRRTQDWKFPSMAPPASANPEVSRFPALQRPSVTPASGARPALVHHPTEPTSLPSQSSHSLVQPAPVSDRMSLIDLDMSIPEPSRPSTADSAASQDTALANPFMWERHASMYHAQSHRSAREPSLYLDESASGLNMRTGSTLQELVEVSDFSASDAESYPEEQYNGYRARLEDQSPESYFGQSAAGHMQGDYEISNPNTINNRAPWDAMNSSTGPQSSALFHPLPPPPSAAVLSGTATYAEMHAESHRMFGTLKASLETFRDTYESMPTRPPKNNQSTSGDDTRGASSMHDTGSNIS